MVSKNNNKRSVDVESVKTSHFKVYQNEILIEHKDWVS